MQNTKAYAFLLLMIVIIAYIYKYPRYESQKSKIIGELPAMSERVPKRLRHKLRQENNKQTKSKKDNTK